MDEEHDTRVEQNQSKQKSKNLESFQQAVLIYLLSLSGVIVSIKKQKKSAEKTYQIQPVQTISYNNQTIQFAETIERQATKLLEEDTSEQRLRRYERNKIAIAFNELVEIAVKLGYEFAEKNTRKSQKTIRMKKITTVKKEGKTVIDQKDIEPVGMAVNNYIVSHFNEGICVCSQDLVNNVQKTVNSQRSLNTPTQSEVKLKITNPSLNVTEIKKEAPPLIIPHSIKSNPPMVAGMIQTLNVPMMSGVPDTATQFLITNEIPSMGYTDEIVDGIDDEIGDEVGDGEGPVDIPPEEQERYSQFVQTQQQGNEDAISEVSLSGNGVQIQSDQLFIPPHPIYVVNTLAIPSTINNGSVTSSDFPVPNLLTPIKREEPHFNFGNFQKIDLAMSQDINNDLAMSQDIKDDQPCNNGQNPFFSFSNNDDDMRTSSDVVDSFYSPNEFNRFSRFGKGTTF